MRKSLLSFAACALASLQLSAQNTSPFWSLAGNSNATASSKLGTTNNVPLRILTNNIERMRIDPTGKVGIGTTNPSGKLTVFGSGGAPAASWVTSGIPIFAGFGENVAGNADHILAMASNAPNARAVFLGRRARGTLSAPAAVQNNDYLLSLFGSGYDGSAFQSPATVDFFVDGAVSSGVVPTRISISTGSGFGNRTERLKVGSTGNIDINNAQLFVQNSTGFVGIGTPSPATKLLLKDGSFRMEETSAQSRYLEMFRPGAPIDWRFEHNNNGRYLFLSFSSSDFNGFVDRALFDTVSVATGGYGFYNYSKAVGYAWDIFSDKKLKNNIVDLSNATAILSKLRPKTYLFNQTAYRALHLPAAKQYGLIAQDVEKILPDLVTTSKVPINGNSSGERQMEEIKSVNYTALIPLLIKGSQEQEEHLKKQDSLIEQQRQQIAELTDLVKQLSGIAPVNTSTATLGQNRPNPGDGTTSITYTIPSDARRARLVLTDNAGKLLRNMQLTGSGTIQMSTTGLAAGVYQYSLILDDRTVQTRKMVVTR